MEKEESDIEFLDRIWNLDKEKLNRMAKYLFKDDPMFKLEYINKYANIGHIDYTEVEGAIAKMNEYRNRYRNK